MNVVGKIVIWVFVVMAVWFLFTPSSDPLLESFAENKSGEQTEIQGCSIEEIERSLDKVRDQSIQGTVKAVGKPFWTQLKEYLGVMGKVKDLYNKSLLLIDNVIKGDCM